MYEIPQVDASDEDEEGTILKTIQLVNEQIQRQQQPQFSGATGLSSYSNMPQPIKSYF